MTWTDLIWLQIGSSCAILGQRSWNPGLHKRQ